MQTLLNVLYHPRLGFIVLRFAVAGLMLFHGVAKLMKGVGGIEGMVVGHGLPGWVAYGVFIGELVAPLLVLIGVLVGPAALVMAVNMAVAVYLAHTSQLLTLGESGGWALELQGLFFFGSLAIALMAPPTRR